MSYHIDNQLSLFDWVWQGAIEPGHELVKLANKITWDKITDSLSKFYSKKGRHCKAIRLMVGLLILKHRDNISDKEVVDKLHENVYYLYFCGVQVSMAFIKDKKLVEESTLSKFRRRMGAKGMELVESIIREQLIKEKKMSPRTHIVDTTAMEKHIEYPTDSSLLDKGRKRLIKAIRKLKDCGVKIPRGLRSFSRVGKKVFISINKFSKRSEEQIKQGIKKLSSYATHVVKRTPDIRARAQRRLRRLKRSGGVKITQTIRAMTSELTQTTKIVKKVIYQSLQRLKGIHLPNKIYSIHEPEVTCIRKGKRAKPNEYGSKVRLSIDRNGFVVSHKEYTTNLSDTETIQDACNDWKGIFNTSSRELAADRGFHQARQDYPQELSSIKRLAIQSKGKAPHPHSKTYWFKRLQRKRSTIEPLISHLKQDHRMNRSRYRGFQGDQINASLAVIAWNTKKWVKPPAI